MKIEIFGAGCAKCVRLEENVRKAVEKSGVDADITVAKDLDVMVRRGVLFPPAVYIDGKEAVAGRVPAVSEICKLLARKKRQ